MPAAARRMAIGTCCQRGSRYGGGTMTPMPMRAVEREVLAEAGVQVAAPMIEGRHVNAGDGHRDVRLAPARRLRPRRRER